MWVVLLATAQRGYAASRTRQHVLSQATQGGNLVEPDDNTAGQSSDAREIAAAGDAGQVCSEVYLHCEFRYPEICSIQSRDYIPPQYLKSNGCFEKMTWCC